MLKVQRADLKEDQGKSGPDGVQTASWHARCLAIHIPLDEIHAAHLLLEPIVKTPKGHSPYLDRIVSGPARAYSDLFSVAIPIRQGSPEGDHAT
jgi:hypothetical protein